MDAIMDCNNCANVYHDNDGLKRCRQSGLGTELILKAEDFMSILCRYHIPVPESLIPIIVRQRWDEEMRLNRLTGWRTLSQLCSSIAINAERYQPGSRLAKIMADKAEEAYQRMAALQPKIEEKDGNA